MNLLVVSDKDCPFVYNSNIKERFKDIDLAISCGDLSYFYLEYIISTLDIPLYYVHGNHDKEIEYGHGCTRSHPWGAINLHQKVIRHKNSGLLLAGVEGSLRYNQGNFQSTQSEMWLSVMQLVPKLLINKARFGRYLDVFVSHAPAWGIHDKEDLPHQGIKAFLWLVKTFQPTYHLHGHVHIYHSGTISETPLGETTIYNTYGHRRLSIDLTGP